MGEKQICIDTLCDLETVTSPSLSPDGKTVLAVATSIDHVKNDYISNVYSFKVQEKNVPLQLTFGTNKHISPKWSPTGHAFAFLSDRSGRMQLFVKVGLADARQLTDVDGAVTKFSWAPDGRHIVFSTRVKARGSIEEAAQDHLPQPHVVEKMKYKSDSRGMFDDSVQQMALVSTDKAEVTWLTNDHYDIQLHGFSPDGSALLMSGDERDHHDFSFLADLWLLSLEDGKREKLTSASLVIQDACFSPDGAYVAILGHQREFENATQPKLFLYKRATKTVQMLAEDKDVYIGDVMIGDFLQQVVDQGIKWTDDSQAIDALVSQKGAVHLWRFHLNGDVTTLIEGAQHIHGYDIQSDCVVATMSTVERPSAVYSVNLRTDDLVLIHDGNEQLSLEKSYPEPVYYERDDGTFVAGWLMKPTHFEEGKKYPLILEVHGGPHAMYGVTYFHEFQVLCAQGYGVLFTNPRGGHGYGQTFVDAVRSDYGGGDFRDLMDVLDFTLAQHDWIDRSRLGLTGGSYGGFMTNWVIGHTNRFKAAVTQRSISNWISFYGVSDIGYYFTEWQIGADLSDIATLWHHSPLKYVEKVETPLLILHSENDLRCPIEQAEQLFIALKRLGKEATFMRFPEANHELSRSGKPNLRFARLQAIVDWFEKYL